MDGDLGRCEPQSPRSLYKTNVYTNLPGKYHIHMKQAERATMPGISEVLDCIGVDRCSSLTRRILKSQAKRAMGRLHY